MKHITRRRADREVRLGTWRVIILHRAASHPISGNALHRELTDRGHKIFLSTFHDALHGMQRNGLLKSREVPGTTRREFRITEKGWQHLAQLRQELASAYDEVVRGANPRPAREPSVVDKNLDGLHLVVEAIRASRRQRAEMRAALEQIQAIIADALG